MSVFGRLYGRVWGVWKEEGGCLMIEAMAAASAEWLVNGGERMAGPCPPAAAVLKCAVCGE
jgi:hypothetical protein